MHALRAYEQVSHACLSLLQSNLLIVEKRREGSPCRSPAPPSAALAALTTRADMLVSSVGPRLILLAVTRLALLARDRCRDVGSGAAAPEPVGIDMGLATRVFPGGPRAAAAGGDSMGVEGSAAAAAAVAAAKFRWKGDTSPPSPDP